MIKKRSNFWTVVFAFLPGAGHMFNGFMKLGVSFMGLFFALLAFASFINIGALTFLAPIIWFYAFFDCINRTFQDDEEFYSQEDHFLFTKEQLINFNFNLEGKKGLIIGLILIIAGVYALWNNVVLHILSSYNILPPAIYEIVMNFSYILPQLVVGVLIIWAGVALIKGKKQQLEVKENAEKDREIKEGEVSGNDDKE